MRKRQQFEQFASNPPSLSDTKVSSDIEKDNNSNIGTPNVEEAQVQDGYQVAYLYSAWYNVNNVYSKKLDDSTDQEKFEEEVNNEDEDMRNIRDEAIKQSTLPSGTDYKTSVPAQKNNNNSVGINNNNSNQFMKSSSSQQQATKKMVYSQYREMLKRYEQSSRL